MGHPLDPEQLLRQDQFLKALARGLVVDPNRADDHAQQAWLVALTHEAPQSVLDWLATVVRRIALRVRREDARREARERAAARAEAAPSDASILEREEVRRSVVAAVLRLEEPYRTTIVLRFLEGLPPRAVARRMAAKVATVRTRVRRGLEQLRVDLDRRYGGERAAWSSALVPFALPAQLPPPVLLSSLAGALALTTKTKLSIAACAGVVLAILVWATAPVAGSPGQEPGVVPVASATSAGLRPSTAASREAVAAAESRSGTAASLPTGSLLVHAQWADGTPAAGLLVALAENGPSHDLHVIERQVRTDAAGAALFEALPPGRVRAYLDRGVSHNATIAAGRRGELVLRPGRESSMAGRDSCNVAGIVVDAHDVPVAGAEVLVSLGMDSQSVQVVAARTADDGTFALRDVNGGSLLAARASGHAASRCDATLYRPFKAGDRAEVVRVKLVLSGLAGRVTGSVRDARGVPIVGATVQVGKGLIGAVMTVGNPPHPVLTRTDAQGQFACGGVPAGRSPVAVRAPGYGAFVGTVEVVEGHESVLNVDLQPGVTVRGTVRRPDGRPVEDAWIGPRTDGKGLASSGTNTAADGTYALPDLAAGDLALEAQIPEYGRKTVSFRAHPGETLTWDVALGVGPTLKGRVVNERGEPLQAVVTARASAAAAHDVSTDVSGRFAFLDWVEEPTRLLVKQSGWDITQLEGVRPSQGEVVVTVRDADRPSGFLTGRLVGPDGRPFAGAELRVVVLDDMSSRSAQCKPDAAGAFRIGPLPAGRYAVQIEPRDLGPLRTPEHRLAAGETHDCGVLCLEQPGFLAMTGAWRDGMKPRELYWTVNDARGGLLGGVAFVQGRIEPTPFAPGAYTLNIRGSGIAAAVREFTIRAGETTRLEADLQPGQDLKLLVTVPTADPKALLSVQIRDAQGAVAFALCGFAAWRKPGHFETSLALAPGSYRAEVQCGHTARETFDLTVAAGNEARTIEWTLR